MFFKSSRLFAFLLVLIGTAFAVKPMNVTLDFKKTTVEILWDTYGVPHIYGDTLDVVSYGYGYAQGRDHSNTLLRFIGIARGKASEYWGENYRLLDIRTLSHRTFQYANSLYYRQNPESVTAYENFAFGFNKYVEDHPEEILAPLKQILPVSGLDFFAHGIRTYFEFSFATAYLIRLPNAENKTDAFKERFEGKNGYHYAAYADHAMIRRPFEQFKHAFGSNGWAINFNSGRSSGNAMINMNPHLPYGSFFRWYEAHFIIASEDLDIYGTGFVGTPNIQIGFNRFLGWTHTVNDIQPYTTYLIDLVGDNQYYLDSTLYTLRTETFPFKVKLADGSFVEEYVIIESSIHGDISQRSGSQAIAVRLAGLDRPNTVYQWTMMGRARNLEQFKEAMSDLQLSMFTTITATKDGDIMHLFNGFVPVRNEGDFAFWSKPVPGHSSRYIWTEIHSFEELPRVENPESGYVQNANESPWTCTLPLYARGADPNSYPPYLSSPPYMGYRPQVSTRLMSTNFNITFEKFVELKHSTMKEYAFKAVPELLVAIEQYGNGDRDLIRAAEILSAWNYNFDGDQSGPDLFKAWANQVGNPWANQWSDSDPLGTPNTLADPAGAVAALSEGIRILRLRGLDLDVTWGETHRLPNGARPDLVLPGNGDDDTFRNTWWGGNRYVSPVGGDSFVCIVEFTRTTPRASSLISYGNASPNSRGANKFGHINDQMERYSQKTLKPVHLSRDDILANLEEHVILTLP